MQSGNLAVCTTDSIGSIGGGGKRCLDSVFDDIPKPLFRAPGDGDGTIGVIGSSNSIIIDRNDDLFDQAPSSNSIIIDQDTETPAMNWRFDNGLLRAVVAGDEENEDLCLAPASPITTGSSEPVDLVLWKCPKRNEDEDDADDRSVTLARTQEMRFVVTAEGRIVSLAPMVDPVNGRDETGTTTSLFCLTLLTGSDYEKVSLAPCEITNEAVHHQQVFEVSGTYSETFLMPLRQTWGYQERVLIAYQLGLPPSPEKADGALATGSDADADAHVEISMLWPIHGSSHQTLKPMVVETFPLSGSSSTGGGFLWFVPSDHKVDGHMTATLKQRSAVVDEDDLWLVRNEVTFTVSKADVPIGKGPNGHYVIFVILLGCMLGCFALSILAERICGSRTRAEEDGTNDGKTVCMSVDEDEEDEGFALEDEDDPEQPTADSCSCCGGCPENKAPENNESDEDTMVSTIDTSRHGSSSESDEEDRDQAVREPNDASDNV